MPKRISGFFPLLMLGMAFGLFGCAYVQDAPQQDTQYIEVPYTGQVPAQTVQDLEDQYPPGFWDDQQLPLANQATVAIKEFATNPPQPDLGRSFADMLASALVNSGQVRVVERENISSLLTELEFSQTGLSATPSGYETGRMHTVDYVITGSISDVADRKRVEVKALDVLSGEIFASESMVVDQVNTGVANSLAGMLLGTMRRR